MENCIFSFLKKVIYLVVLLFIYTGNSYSQNHYCGFDLMQNTKSIAEKNEIAEVNKKLYTSLQSKNPSRNDVIRTIPVVFHVMHQNGPENVADSSIFDLLDQLNLRYQNSAPYYDITGTETNIQFCLASIDPLGNPTTGITRDTTIYTDVNWTGPFTNEIAMKNINRWNPLLYLNIWIVRSTLPVVSGFSSFPSDAGHANDGIVIQYQNSIVGQPYTLSHEVGHYLGLYHTFDGLSNCINNNCLLDGDRICDTPPDVTIFGVCDTNSCSTEMNDTSGFNPFVSDVNDLPNYMDYTLCPLSFTQGQSARMNATLTEIRYALLQSNGCGANPGGAIPEASFTHEMSCSGETFINTSLNSLNAEWDFENDGIYDMNGDTVIYNYPASGTYTIKMRVTGFGGSDSTSQPTYIQDRIQASYPIIQHTGYSYSPYTTKNYSCVGNLITVYGWPSMASYLWSNGDTTQNISFVADSSFDLSLTVVDMDGYTWTSCPAPIHVDIAPALTKPIIYSDEDSICISDSLHFHALMGENQYVNSWIFNYAEYFSTDPQFNTVGTSWDDFIYVTIRDVNGCKINSDTSFIYADSSLNQPYIMNQIGTTLFANTNCINQFYKDGEPIENATDNQYLVDQPGCYSVLSWYHYPNCAVMSDTICFTVTAINEFESNLNFIVFPNPAKEYLTIQGMSKENTTFSLYNTLGQEVLYEKLKTNSCFNHITLKTLSNGIYFWKLNSNSEVNYTGKVLISN